MEDLFKDENARPEILILRNPPGVEAIRFQNMVHGEQEEATDDELEGEFFPYLSNGQLFEEEEEEKPQAPEIDYDELNRRKLEQLERDTYQKAFQAGEQAGLEMGEEKINLVLARLEGVIDGLDNRPQEIFNASEAFMVETSLVLLKKLFKHELTVNPEGILQRVRAILKEAGDRDAMALRLNPDDAAYVSRLGEFKKIEVVPDQNVNPGSVALETAFGSINDDLYRQLGDVEESLRGYLASRLPETAERMPPPTDPADLMPDSQEAAPEPVEEEANTLPDPVALEEDAAASLVDQFLSDDPMPGLEQPVVEPTPEPQAAPEPKAVAPEPQVALEEEAPLAPPDAAPPGDADRMAALDQFLSETEETPLASPEPAITEPAKPAPPPPPAAPPGDPERMAMLDQILAESEAEAAPEVAPEAEAVAAPKVSPPSEAAPEAEAAPPSEGRVDDDLEAEIAAAMEAGGDDALEADIDAAMAAKPEREADAAPEADAKPEEPLSPPGSAPAGDAERMAALDQFLTETENMPIPEPEADAAPAEPEEAVPPPPPAAPPGDPTRMALLDQILAAPEPEAEPDAKKDDEESGEGDG